MKDLKKASNFYFLVKGFTRYKDIENKYKIGINNIYLKKISFYGTEIWTKREREEEGEGSKIQDKETKVLRGILGKTRRDKIRNK